MLKGLRACRLNGVHMITYKQMGLENSLRQTQSKATKATCSCLVSLSATVSSSVLVGFSEQRTTRRTLRSSCSRRPLANAPTRTTLRSNRLSDDVTSVGFLLHNSFSTQRCNTLMHRYVTMAGTCLPQVTLRTRRFEPQSITLFIGHTIQTQTTPPLVQPFLNSSPVCPTHRPHYV